MATTVQDAISALAAHLGIPLDLRDDSCEFLVGGQPFSIRHDADLERLVVSALVADDLPPAPSRALVCDLLNLGFGMMSEGGPAVARDPETGFLAAFALFPLGTLSPAEFPDAFDKFAAFATALADRLDAERAGASGAPDNVPPVDGETSSPAYRAGFISV
ncbi:MAG: CesT family type III secretion system chaperone [Kiritimatiellae bacterium]|nr:CesT family type III secretion system chaperone [Kiritimatiellia bacterium]